MRLRRKPWARPELAACPFVVDVPETLRSKWAGAFLRRAPLHLELGCGKGGFIAETAVRSPQINFIAVDLKSEVLALAKRKAEQAFLESGRAVDNLLLMSYDIERIDRMLSPIDRVERIYINFCNPWPKIRNFKHRLTHERQLEMYKTFLAPNGEIFFKTDDDLLFEATLGSLAQCGFAVVEQVENLPQTHPACAVMTEHERMFREMGRPVKYIAARRLEGMP